MAEQRIGGVDAGEMAEILGGLRDEVIDVVQQARERLELDRRMRENPWAVLGVAAGAGFVLGGGLWPALRPFVKAAGRTALAPSNLLALVAALGAMKAAQGQAGEGESAGTAPTTPTSH